MTFTLSPDGAKEELDVFIEKMKTGEGHFIRKTSTLIKEKTVIIGYSRKQFMWELTRIMIFPMKL